MKILLTFLTALLLLTTSAKSQLRVAVGAGQAFNAPSGVGEINFGYTYDNYNATVGQIVAFRDDKPVIWTGTVGYTLANIKPFLGASYHLMSVDRHDIQNGWFVDGGFQADYNPFYLKAEQSGHFSILTAGVYADFSKKKVHAHSVKF